MPQTKKDADSVQKMLERLQAGAIRRNVLRRVVLRDAAYQRSLRLWLFGSFLVTAQGNVSETKQSVQLQAASSTHTELPQMTPWFL